LGSVNRISRDVWEELWDATLFKLKAAEASIP